MVVLCKSLPLPASSDVTCSCAFVRNDSTSPTAFSSVSLKSPGIDTLPPECPSDVVTSDRILIPTIASIASLLSQQVQRLSNHLLRRVYCGGIHLIRAHSAH